MRARGFADSIARNTEGRIAPGLYSNGIQKSEATLVESCEPERVCSCRCGQKKQFGPESFARCCLSNRILTAGKIINDNPARSNGI